MPGDERSNRNLARYDPLDKMIERLARWPYEMGDFFRPVYGMLPRFDLRMPLEYTEEKEDGTGLVSKLEMPGIKPEDITVVVENGYLKIDGARKEEKEDGEKGKKGYSYRMSHADYHLRMLLPEEVDEDKISTTLEDGILTLDLPYKEAAEAKPEPKKIEVKSK